ncbi:unnamed protein product [Adineta ricciae]|uniref:Uncharacterized protein n=1 Tax=Adineta ricciae TaxID=249248 RepID=A0A813UJW0_ADIRI|nr:unnamed protein product [Adineta ricciae]CAF1352151.1 unnamed protein product [Adineta ricciae]
MIPAWIKYFLVRIRSKKSARESNQRSSTNQSTGFRIEYGQIYGYEYVLQINDNKQNDSSVHRSINAKQNSKRTKPNFNRSNGGRNTYTKADAIYVSGYTGVGDGSHDAADLLCSGGDDGGGYGGAGDCGGDGGDD